ncbi:MAG: hypothetical protein UZ14_CFX002000372 [Chloroflexi bacterium OLB14]|nr:MAG: hypothetical protein UZ14_CFX002000372 [Chloroflexi bacterium OLB14]
MDTSLFQFIVLLFIAALYLPIIFFAIQRRDEGGHAFATWLVILYALIALVINVAEASWKNGSDENAFFGD